MYRFVEPVAVHVADGPAAGVPRDHVGQQGLHAVVATVADRFFGARGTGAALRTTLVLEATSSLRERRDEDYGVQPLLPT